MDVFNHDWMGKYHGQSQVVLKPKTTDEVSKLVAYCVQVSLFECVIIPPKQAVELNHLFNEKISNV